ncbi:MAG TPA: glycosyltransferase family 39 protein [Anaerolineaceae bacterium]|nr:glycosyltransferase family 39 protein [Anaerolineaceae bacterium]HPN53349.1 glycosyltransferase family 39 protein [Anaerolineaceae bacterium]
MWVILPAAFFALLWLHCTRTDGWRAAWLKAAAVTAAWAALSAEGLSLLGALRPEGLLVAWAVPLVSLALASFKMGVPRLRWPVFSRWEKFLLAGLALWLGAVLTAALLAPPNTNDSLTYHLPRVMHWLQNGSLEHYFTGNDRQLWNPPGAELLILHLVGLSGGDALANLPQWFSLLGIVLGASLLAQELGAGRRGQWAAALFAATLPMLILQASSTQNDAVTAFWALALAWWVVRALRGPLNFSGWLLFSLTAALGVLTKGTFYAFAAPLLAWLLLGLLRQRRFAELRFVLLGAAVVLLLNGGLWSRNLQLYHSPLGPGVSDLGNEAPGLASLVSITLKNAAAQSAAPLGRINQAVYSAVEALHNLLGMDLNDPRTSFRDFAIQLNLTSEDYAVNPLHFWLLWLACLSAWLKPRLKDNAACALALLACFLLFSLLFKWQPWGGRLILPFFVLGAPLAGAELERRTAGKRAAAAGWAGLALLALIGLQPLLYNSARPLLPAGENRLTVFSASRQDLLYINAPELRSSYEELARWVKVTRCDRLGLLLNPSDNEYVLWAQLSPGAQGVEIRHLDPPQPLNGPWQPCAVMVADTEFDETRLPGYGLAESRLGVRLFVLNELLPLIR